MLDVTPVGGPIQDISDEFVTIWVTEEDTPKGNELPTPYAAEQQGLRFPLSQDTGYVLQIPKPDDLPPNAKNGDRIVVWCVKRNGKVVIAKLKRYVELKK